MVYRDMAFVGAGGVGGGGAVPLPDGRRQKIEGEVRPSECVCAHTSWYVWAWAGPKVVGVLIQAVQKQCTLESACVFVSISVCVCVCVCACVHVCMCMYVSMCVCMCVCVRVCVLARAHSMSMLYSCLCVFLCLYLCVFVCICLRVCEWKRR